MHDDSIGVELRQLSELARVEIARGLAAHDATTKRDCRLLAQGLVRILIQVGVAEDEAERAVRTLWPKYEDSAITDLYQRCRVQLEALEYWPEGAAGRPSRNDIFAHFAKLRDDQKGTRGAYGAHAFKNAFEAWAKNKGAAEHEAVSLAEMRTLTPSGSTKN